MLRKRGWLGLGACVGVRVECGLAARGGEEVASACRPACTPRCPGSRPPRPRLATPPRRVRPHAHGVCPTPPVPGTFHGSIALPASSSAELKSSACLSISDY